MNAQQWYLLGGVLSALGVLILVVGQVILGQWLKVWKEE